MLQVRGLMMVKGDYSEATYESADLAEGTCTTIIGDYARKIDCPHAAVFGERTLFTPRQWPWDSVRRIPVRSAPFWKNEPEPQRAARQINKKHSVLVAQPSSLWISMTAARPKPTG